MAKKREVPIELDKDEFKKIGYELIDTLSQFIETIEERPVTKNESTKQLQQVLGMSPLPEFGIPVAELLSRATDLLIDHSLFNGHPKFLGYITSSAAPLGALADLLAASINPNVGAHTLSPMATEIEKQTIQWLAEFIGVSPYYGGILVSGGNMANFTAFLAARTAKGPKSIKESGFYSMAERLTVYCSKTTHTWIDKAVILFGLGQDSIRWIPTEGNNKMNTIELENAIKKDIENGFKPMMIVGTAGDVSTGTVDNLSEIAKICKKFNLWFHIDGAYGVPAAVLPELEDLFLGIEEADSIALDPHKWLYNPLEVGCTLVKNPQHLLDTFSSHPEYYNFNKNEDDFKQNFYEYGLQNSRGFRALKVWLILQQVGKSGYIKMIREDIALAKLLFDEANNHPELDAVTHNLSITTLRYLPEGIDTSNSTYLNELNETLLNELQQEGEVFLSNAIVSEQYCLRGCIVNFRTSQKDIKEIIEYIVKLGRKVHGDLNKKLS